MFDVTTQQQLAQPFPASLIRQRKQEWNDKAGQRHVMRFDYVETAAVIDRLNHVFGYAWSFTVQEARQCESQILVCGTLTARGVTKTAFGGAVIGPGEEGTINAYKAAVGDAIKLCAKQFGIGLHLWMSE